MVLEALAAGASIASGLGSLFGDSGSKDAKKAQRMAANIAGQAFQGVPVLGPGGIGLSFGPGGGFGGPSGFLGGNNFTNQLGPGGGGFATIGGPGGVPGGQGGFIPSGGSFGGAENNFGFAEPGKPLGFDPATGIHFDGNGNPLPPGTRQVKGGRGTIFSDVGQVNVGAGNLTDSRNLLGMFAEGALGGLGRGTSAVQDQAFANLLASAGGFGQQQGTLDALLNAAGGAFGGAQGQLQDAQNNPFLAGLQGQLFGDAGNLFAEAAQGGEAQRQQTLDLLRQQAQPFEERAFSNLQDRQFATGQSGTSGGALQTEAFARGLGQADLQRQLTASEEGRAAQNAALQTGLGLAGQGTGLRTLQDNLLNQAQNRFAGLANLSSNLAGQRTQANQGAFNQNLQVLQNALLPQLQAQQLQGGSLQNALAALGGIQGIDANALNFANLGLNFSQSQANSRLGAATTAAGIPIPASNTPTALAQLSQALAPQGGALQALGGLFGLGGGGNQGGPDLSTLAGIAPNLPG